MIQESVELKGGEMLQVGQARLRFVPLCGPSFDWSLAADREKVAWWRGFTMKEWHKAAVHARKMITEFSNCHQN